MFKKFCLMLLIAAFSTHLFAQEQEETDKSEPAFERVYHNLIFSVGSSDFDEDNAAFREILSDLGVVDGSIVAFDMSDEAYKLTEMTHLSRYFALEGELGYYGWSEMVVSDGEGTSHNLRARYSNLALHAVGKYPLFGGRLSAYAKGGASLAHVEFDLNHHSTGNDGLMASQDEDEVAASYGLGLIGDLTDRFMVRLDHSMTKMNDLETSVTTVGFGFRFE